MDVKERVLRITYDLISRYGIASVTMDYIAKECGISKRTLYELFDDKNSLLVKTMILHNEEQSKAFQKINEESPNRLIAFLKIYTIIKDYISNLCDSFFIDMDRLYPLIAKEYGEIKKQHVLGLREMLEVGKREGVFRKDICSDIAAALYFNEMHNIKQKLREYNIGNNAFTYTEIYSECFECYLRGIASPMGIEIFEKFKQENKNKF